MSDWSFSLEELDNTRPPDRVLQMLLPLLPEMQAIEFAWLSGSFARGDNDRYSDIDLHLFAPSADSALSLSKELLGQIAEVALTKELLGGSLCHSLLSNGARVDILLYREYPKDIAGGKVVFSRNDKWLPNTITASPNNLVSQKAEELLATLEEFWRCIALLPSVFGRGESVVSLQGLGIEVGLYTKILGIHFEKPATGIKRLDQFLPPEFQNSLAGLRVDCSDRHSLVNAHLFVADLVSTIGRRAAEKLAIEYPARLEQAARDYVSSELTNPGYVLKGARAGG